MSNLSRNIVLYIDSHSYVTYFNNGDAPDAPEGVEVFPILSVNTVSEAETLRVLFCERETWDSGMYFLPGFQGTKEDLPFARNRFIDAYDQIRNL